MHVIFRLKNRLLTVHNNVVNCTMLLLAKDKKQSKLWGQLCFPTQLFLWGMKPWQILSLRRSYKPSPVIYFQQNFLHYCSVTKNLFLSAHWYFNRTVDTFLILYIPCQKPEFGIVLIVYWLLSTVSCFTERNNPLTLKALKIWSWIAEPILILHSNAF